MICLLTALPSEAKPLLRHFRLQGGPEPGPFTCYFGDEVALVVSGIGKIAAAAGCAYLYGQLQHRDGGTASQLDTAAWINVGIAGHGSLPLGEALLAHESLDRASGRRHFPPLVIEPPCRTDTVITVDGVERAYDPPVAYDMEAAAFFQVARRFTHAELVHSLKVVSDSPAAAPEHIDAAKVETWIGDRLHVLDALIDACRRLRAEMAPLHGDPPDFEDCLRRWHFTTSDRHQLRRLLRRRQTLAPDAPLPLVDFSAEAGGAVRGRRINQELSAWLDGLPVDFNQPET